MFNPLSDQDAETKFKRNKGGELELDADQSLEGKEQRMDKQVEELEAARAKQDQVAGLAKKVVKKVSQKAGGARRKTPSKSPARSPAAVSNAVGKMVKAGLAQRAGREASPSQKLLLKKNLNELGADFGQNLARIYNKGAHKSGV